MMRELPFGEHGKCQPAADSARGSTRIIRDTCRVEMHNPPDCVAIGFIKTLHLVHSRWLIPPPD